MTDECLFCRIAEGTLPCAKVYETDRLLAFLDINPAFPGHTLIIPKRHAETLFTLDEPVGDELLLTMRCVGAAVMEATGAAGLNVIQNNGRAAWQQVDHVHWHLIPRFPDDGFAPWKQEAYGSPDAMRIMAETIRNNIRA